MGRISSRMATQCESEVKPLLKNDEEEAEIISEITEFLKFGKKENNTEQTKNETKNSTKRKRKIEDNTAPNTISEVFLRIFYPISLCLGKSISIGLVKSLDYSPTVILNHGPKMVLFSPNAWESFLKHLHLIECYLTSSLCGRKTNIRLLDCDNEIDVVKHRGHLQVRIRDLTQHDNKVLLTREEFCVLNCATSPITRYMRQLVFSSSVIKDYLVDTLEKKDYLIDTLEKQHDSTILYGPVDTSIFNRLPHEVDMWRQLRNIKVEETAADEETAAAEEETAAETAAAEETTAELQQ